MKLLSLLALLCVAVLSTEATFKCNKFGEICSKGKNCAPVLGKPGLTCQSSKKIGGCADLCQFGGKYCPDGKICKYSKGRRVCVFPKKYKVKKCTKFGKSCAPGRKCIPCYLRKGLCCRRAALLRKDYCGLKYKVYGKKCGTKYFKKGCYKVGNYCPDGKQCRKYKNGKLACVFKKKLPACNSYGQLCGKKNDRNCQYCFLRKGLCCRRRKLLGPAAKHCRYGGKWCPKGLTCRQSIKNGVVIRRCVYIPKCKRAGQSCGIFKRKVCVKCGKKLCCRRGVTKPQCKKRCNVWWKKCSLKCRKGFIGWCCKPRKITKPQCLKRCKGKYKYCSKKGCAKGFLGYCCKTRPYISLKKCLHTCKGKYRYCSKNKCPKNIRGYCCKKRPVITRKQCLKTCKGKYRYCSNKKCPKNIRGYCCKTRPYISLKNQKECREFGDICGKYKNCVPDHRGYLQCRDRHQLDGAAHLCRFGGDWCPDGKLCKKTSHGRRCVWDHKNEHEIKKCSKSRVTKYCAQGRKCMHCYLRKGLCCRRAAIIDHKNYCGIKYKSHDHTACGHQHDRKSSCYLVGKFCPDGKHCKKIGHGKYTCESKKKLPKCHEFGQLCGKYHKRNCVPCFSRKGLCCRRRSKLGPAAKHCRYGGKWCPKNKTCKQKSRNGIVLRRCIYIPRCKHYGDTCGYKKNKVCLRCGHKLCCKKGVTKDKCKKHCNVFWKKCTINKCRHNSKGWCCKPWKITRDECDRHCIGRWKYCTDRGCSKDYIGYCCKSQPYVTKKQCQQICYGPDKYCTNKFCPRDIRGHCCKTRRPRPRPPRPTAPHVQYCKHAGDSCGYKGGKVCQRCSKAKLCCRPGVTMEKCKRTCTGKGQYCSFTECPKAFKGWCCTYCKRSNCKLL